MQVLGAKISKLKEGGEIGEIGIGLLFGSRVYGSKISKIAEDTELSKEQVENTLRRLLSSDLVSRDKTRKPTRWFPDW